MTERKEEARLSYWQLVLDSLISSVAYMVVFYVMYVAFKSLGVDRNLSLALAVVGSLAPRTLV